MQRDRMQNALKNSLDSIANNYPRVQLLGERGLKRHSHDASVLRMTKGKEIVAADVPAIAWLQVCVEYAGADRATIHNNNYWALTVTPALL